MTVSPSPIERRHISSTPRAADRSSATAVLLVSGGVDDDPVTQEWTRRDPRGCAQQLRVQQCAKSLGVRCPGRTRVPRLPDND